MFDRIVHSKPPAANNHLLSGLLGCRHQHHRRASQQPYCSANSSSGDFLSETSYVLDNGDLVCCCKTLRCPAECAGLRHGCCHGFQGGSWITVARPRCSGSARHGAKKQQVPEECLEGAGAKSTVVSLTLPLKKRWEDKASSAAATWSMIVLHPFCAGLGRWCTQGDTELVVFLPVANGKTRKHKPSTFKAKSQPP